METPRSRELWRSTLPVVALLALMVMLFSLIYVATELFLLLFVGVLLALLLRAVARPLERAHLPPGLAYALAATSFFLVLGAILLLFGPLIVNGFVQLAGSLQSALDRLSVHLEDHPALRRNLEQLLGGQGAGLASQTLARISGVFSTVFGAVTAVLMVGFTGLYLAAEPGLYLNGLLRLVPLSFRERARALLDELGTLLTRWMFGQFISMTVVGVLTWVGLRILRIPLAGTLAVAAALLDFIPTFGPVIAAVPAVLIAFAIEPLLAAYVVVLYIVVQTLEAYVLTPLVQRQVVHLPPVLVLSVQLLLAVMYGLLGLLVAAPLSVMFMVLVKRLYVEAVLGDRVD